ncbi:beta-ketoacyl synthase chain length factor [Piscinibacter sakaiensis]|uniref:3-oxoacyl-ACP synthase n=1 Tax=Piscinibacter sakaiensis TaxID=1547922 RepID=A0A0K8NTV3_PISS1|nr:beta-ketoacyl synthase chain length factor [Piscinibacter sakaiensis]GAP33793.1 3-oxoacyl-ACP synthase [Piscinibacter sakaiensis]
MTAAPGAPAPVAPIAPLALRAWTVLSAAGAGRAAFAAALSEGRSGLRPDDQGTPPLPTWIGRVEAVDHRPLPPAQAGLDCRATRLARLGLDGDGFRDAVAAACRRHGAGRVGLALGTSASTIGASEAAYRRLGPDGAFPADAGDAALHTPHALAAFVARELGLAGPVVTVSTACSSSARAVGSAARWLALGWVDAVVVAGVDALSGSLLYGFHALQLLDAAPCRPFDAARGGISLGEAAAYALLTRDDDPAAPAALRLAGWGESNDAHHMSAPHPAGRGAEAALDVALARAGWTADQVDQLSLHGTGTAANDAVEAALVARRYRADVAAAALKGLTGHTMGAAGLLGLLASAVALGERCLPGSAPTAAADPAFPAPFARQLRLRSGPGRPRRAASHAFGFGGNNCVLLLEAGPGPADAGAGRGPGPGDHEGGGARRGGPDGDGAPGGRDRPGARGGDTLLWVESLAVWPPPGAAAPAPRPVPTLLGPNERRRAPEAVLAALAVAEAACAEAGQPPRGLPSVFTSAHGDLAVVDALCRTLATDPLHLSPTRFHHSVHNAASGYWAIAAGAEAGSSAVSGASHSFATGLLEAAAVAAADGSPVLLVGADTEARGTLAGVHASRGLLGVALVLAPRPGPRSRIALRLRLQAAEVPRPSPQEPAWQALAGNALADALPLAEALAAGRPATLALPLGPALSLALELAPASPHAATEDGAGGPAARA